jgi:hypothetical protein
LKETEYKVLFDHQEVVRTLCFDSRTKQGTAVTSCHSYYIVLIVLVNLLLATMDVFR